MTEGFTYTATKRQQINYSPPPHDLRVMDLNYTGYLAHTLGKAFQHKDGVGRNGHEDTEGLV